MGRGRAKAKQTRVARDLKYRSFNTDFVSLERELRSEGDDEPLEVSDEEEDDEDDDPYADLATRYAVPDDDEDDVRRIS